MTAKEKELVMAYKKYIYFLGNAYDDMFQFAHTHGYSCRESDIELGQQMRNAIQELENECGLPDENLIGYL